jgi:NitT/TauT family transport system substrate-binding protein
MRIKETVLVFLVMFGMALGLSVWLAAGQAGVQDHDRVSLQLSWRAQAESGGFVEAAARGFYKDCGLNLELRQGGAGYDPNQLLVSGAVDAAIIPGADGIFHMNAAGFPARAVYASMQHSPMVLDVHEDSDIKSLADMAGHPIMISASSRSSWWPYFKRRFGLTDGQLRTFSGQFALFLADPRAVTQDMISNGPYLMWTKSHTKVRSFNISQTGYDPYGGLLVVSQSLIDKRPAVVRCLVEGSQRGWRAFLNQPDHAFAAVEKMSPEVSDGLNRFAFKTLADNTIFTSADTRRLGLGAMSDARWQAHYALLRDTGVVRAGMDPSKVFTNAFLPPAGRYPQP